MEAARLEVLVGTKGLQQVTRDLGGVDDSLRKTAGSAGKTSDKIEDTGKRGSKSIGLLGKAAGALGAVAGFAVLAKGVSSAIGEFEEARKVGALTTSTIKATGGAANITAKEVGELAGSISQKVGMDDEAIQSGANLLLTFKNVRNEVGKGNDVFNQATAAAVDLSAAGFGSIESASKTMGKALNDPVKGMTALGKSGVTFSEDQKKAIAALMETGKASDRLKAQQIILKEVQSQVGGAAAAQATPMDKLKVTMGNLAEAAGSILVPMLDKGAKFLTKLLGGMIESEGVGGAMIDTFKGIGGVLATAAGAVAGIVGWFKEHKTIALALAAAVTVFGAAYLVSLIPALIAATAAIYAQVSAWVALKVAMLTSPIGLMVVAIAALVAGLVVAYRESETFRAIIDAAFKGVVSAFGWILTAAQNVFGWLKSNWPLVLAILTGPIGLAVLAIARSWDTIKSTVSSGVEFVKNVVRGGWELVRSSTAAAWGLIRDAILGALRAARDLMGDVLTGIANRLATAWASIKTAAGAGWDLISGAILAPLRAARDTVQAIVGGLRDWLADRWDTIVKQASVMKDRFVSVFDKIADAIRPVKNLISDVIDGVKSAIEWLGKIKVPKINLPDLNPFGGAGNGTTVGPPKGRPANVDGFNGLAARFGNVVTSGYRPGDDGWHGQNRARDYAGGNMMAFARAMMAYAPSLLELIFTPLGVGVKNGSIVPISFFGSSVMADHYDHVHVAMASGGVVQRSGWAVVGERGPELAHFPGGSTVYDAGQTRGALQPGGPTELRIDGLYIYVGDREVTDIVRVEIEQDGRRSLAQFGAGGLT